MLKLGVNIDHTATLREVRHGIEPEPAFAALAAQSAGADSIVAHLREDRRHIKERDLRVLKEVVKVKLNLEMSIAEDIVDFACKLKPGQATLVPEKRKELTTEGGLDVVSNFKKIEEAAQRLQKNGIGVSLFIDPDKEQINAARKLGLKMIELHTGRYAEAKSEKEQDKFFKEMEEAAKYGREKSMHVFAGHGLDYYNVSRIAGIKEIEELNIGYSIVCRAVMVGFERAVREMRELMR
ncbi:MAG: pyridoxine 5'-phosphate synthase [Candidatus Omnitrophica bacterium]|nr:pyridoxine 5'-phosphate synthase [Candidatus Omnitrophota bacterium]MDD5553958.1 pyridoxine 5'-phosphate synthase [Candidatus Omnitrophota bacterium]